MSSETSRDQEVKKRRRGKLPVAAPPGMRVLSRASVARGYPNPTTQEILRIYAHGYYRIYNWFMGKRIGRVKEVLGSGRHAALLEGKYSIQRLKNGQKPDPSRPHDADLVNGLLRTLYSEIGDKDMSEFSLLAAIRGVAREERSMASVDERARPWLHKVPSRILEGAASSADKAWKDWWRNFRRHFWSRNLEPTKKDLERMETKEREARRILEAQGKNEARRGRPAGKGNRSRKPPFPYLRPMRWNSSNVRMKFSFECSVRDGRAYLPMSAWTRATLKERGIKMSAVSFPIYDRHSFEKGTARENAKAGASVRMKNGRWQFSMSEDRLFPDEIATGAPIGIDVGVRRMVTSSDGRQWMGAKTPKRVDALLRRLNRKANRQGDGERERRAERKRRRAEAGVVEEGRRKRKYKSGKRMRTYARMARIHEDLVNWRRHKIHQATHDVLMSREPMDARPAIVFIEALRVKDLAEKVDVLAKNYGKSGSDKKRKKINKAVVESSMYEILRQVQYKAEQLGIHVHVVDQRKWPSTRTCSECGHVGPEVDLSKDHFDCVSCGVHMEDRKLNAARNLLTSGFMEMGMLPRGSTWADADRVVLSWNSATFSRDDHAEFFLVESQENA